LSLMHCYQPPSILFPYTTLFRSFDWIEPRLGDIMYVDVNGDGTLTPDDQTAIGRSRLPEIMYGINLGANYKGFDFSALIQGAGKDRKSTRLNSSHVKISYAVFCL